MKGFAVKFNKLSGKSLNEKRIEFIFYKCRINLFYVVYNIELTINCWIRRIVDKGLKLAYANWLSNWPKVKL